MLLGCSPLARAGPSARQNLLVNGLFNNDASGWTLGANGGAPAFASASGIGRITVTGSGFAVYYQAIPTIVGRTYRATGNLLGTTGTVSVYLFRKSDDAGVSSNVVTLKTGVGPFETRFTATAAISFISCQINNSTTATGDFDDLQVVPV